MDSFCLIAAAVAIMLQHVVVLLILHIPKAFLSAASAGHDVSVSKAVLADHWCNL